MAGRAKRTGAAVALTIGAVVILTAGYVALARSGAFRLERHELISRYADSESKFVEINGISVHYKDEGQGTPVLLLHGSFGSLRTWDGIVDELKGEYRLIRLDQPPTALSGDIPTSAKDLELEEFIALFLDQLGIQRAILVGTSSGGLIAYRFAAQYPQRTLALGIANSPSAVVDNASIPTPRRLSALSFVSARVLKHQPRLYWRWFLRWLYADPSRVSDAAVQQYFDMARTVRSPLPSSNMYARVNDTAATAEILARVRAPTLLIWGVKDPVLPESMAHQLEAKLSAAPTELILLPETGHYPPLESPLDVAQALKRYIDTLAGTPP